MKLFKKKPHKSKHLHEQKKVRLVLLGTMESGKSTLYNQLRVRNFNEEERQMYISNISHNIVHAMKNIATSANQLNYTFLPANQEAATAILAGNCIIENGRLSEQYITFIKRLCEDPAIRRTLRRRDRIILSDSSLYFITHFPRICQPGYIPTDDDILRARAATTSFNVSDYSFSPYEFQLATNSLSSSSSSSISLSNLDNVSLEVGDIGGYRADRKKWIHIFGNTTCITFVVALDDFCFNLFEDPTINRMEESLSLFHQICNYDDSSSKEYFQTFVLFFNKEDRFKEVVTKVSLQNCFKEYSGKMEYNEVLDFIINKFLSCNVLKKTIHVYVGSAIDSESMNNMLTSVKVHMLKEYLKNM